jgi:hypothetical protein
MRVMVQVYFLSLQIYFLVVLSNILAGAVLCAEYIKEKIPPLAGLIDILQGKEVKFVTGIVALVAGVFKFISPLGIIIVGDLIPALSSCGLGIVMLLDFFKESTTTTPSETIDKVDGLVENYKNLIGGVGLGIAVVHFFFAGVPAFL